MAEQEPVIGIDLGTTNSVVATVQGGQPRGHPQPHRPEPHPLGGGGHRSRASGWWGRSPSARRSPTRRTRSTPPSGSSAGSSARDQVQAGARVAAVPGRLRRARRRPGAAGRARTSRCPEISAAVLRELKLDAEAYFGRPVTQGGDHRPRLLQRRPAAGHQGRRAHRRARRAAHHQRAHRRGAGLRLRQARSTGKIAVFDLGGGTLRRLACSRWARACSTWWPPAATPTWAARTSTTASSRWLVMGFAKEHGVDLRKDRMALQRLKDAAEKAKIELSDAERDAASTCPSSTPRPAAARRSTSRRR